MMLIWKMNSLRCGIRIYTSMAAKPKWGREMTKVYIYCSPDTGKTIMKINNVSINNNSRFYNHIENEKFELLVNGYKEGKMIWKGLLLELVDETNDIEFKITFKGRKRDFKILKDAVESEMNRLKDEDTEASVSFEYEMCGGFEDFCENMQYAAEVLDSQESLIKSIGAEDILKKMERLIENHRESLFKIVVLSRFKGGKSSLINAMTGVNILPSKAMICTSVLTGVRYGDVPFAKVYPESGKPLEINIDDIYEYCTFKQINVPEKIKYKEAEVFLPLKMLKDVEIFDTPDISGGISSSFLHETASLADLIVYTMPSINALNFEDVEIIKELKRYNAGNIVFALTYYDLVDDYEGEFRDAMMSRLSKETGLGTSGVHFISSLDAVKAAQNCDEEGLKKSGITDFKKDLRGLPRKDGGKK